jgi:YHS domain-containing protein
VIRWLLIAILVLFVAHAFWKVVDNIIEAAGGRPSRAKRGRTPAVRLVRDPVCGTHVAPTTSLSLSAGGTTHYFCSEKCRSEFRRR